MTVSYKSATAISPPASNGGGTLQIAAIADDLTGGVEMASMLVARGVTTAFAIGPDGPHVSGREAQVVAMRTRTIDRDAALQQIERALDHLLARLPRQVFFKYCATFDSTPAGNIGPCAEAILDRLQDDFTIFCPTYPEAGRTVYQGHMFVGDQLLAESPKRLDPLTPMTDSNLLRVLAAQSRGSVGLIPFHAVRAGVESVEEAIKQLRRQHVRLAIADAIDNSDIATLASACRGLRFATGNSSIAAELARLLLGRAGGQCQSLPAIDGNAVVLAGSCAARTAEQLEEFARQRPLLRLDVGKICAGDNVIAPAFSWIKEHIASGPVAVATTMEPADVAELQARYGVERAARAVEAALASLAARLVGELNVRRLLIAGGETSGAVLERLGVRSLDVGPFEQPGLSRAVSCGDPRLGLILKSGKLGPVDMFLPALAAMRTPLTGDAREIAKSAATGVGGD